MDNSNQPSRQTDHLGVNKLGKNIKKSPLHQPNFASPARNQPQPQVYNINKNDFRNIVQQLTGSPSRDPPPARPPQNQTRPPNNRLQRVRPPPLAHMNRPQRMPIQAPPQQLAPIPYPFVRPHHPPPPPQFDQQSPNIYLPSTPNDIWSNTNESPVSGYMRYLRNSIIDSNGPRLQGPPLNQFAPPLLPSPRMNGPPSHPPLLPSPTSQFLLPSPTSQFLLPSPTSQFLLPSPTSQFLLPSPNGFMNVLSPRSPYPLLSPAYQHNPPISPNFSFSSVGQSGILGPGPQLPPPSPGYGFPLSPNGFFPFSSPRWRDQ